MYCFACLIFVSFLAIALASRLATSSLPVSLFLQAFKTLLDKTFESVPFDDFLGFFGRDFSETHRDYLFDLYSRSSAIPPPPTLSLSCSTLTLSHSLAAPLAAPRHHAQLCLYDAEQFRGGVWCAGLPDGP